jgi:hypothetical protein
LRRRLSTGLPQYYSFISMILILYTFTGEKQYRMKNLRNFAKKPQKTRKKSDDFTTKRPPKKPLRRWENCGKIKHKFG